MAAKFDWLVQLQDKPGVLATRFQHAAEHMAYHQPNRDAGVLVLSGPTLKEHPVENSPMSVTGSVLVFRVSGGEQEVRQIVENDPLAKAGVWDVENVRITPFKLFAPPS